MIVGVPKEIKNNEYRVALVPSGVEALVEDGHTVLVETGAGLGTQIEDSEYRDAGATIVSSDREVFAQADMIMKVKEPMAPEYELLRPGQIVFTYFHFAANEELTKAMVKSKSVCVAYENHSTAGQDAAAADADERSRGTHGRAGGGEVSGATDGGTRNSAVRRARRAAR